jgi:hypothetical protein
LLACLTVPLAFAGELRAGGATRAKRPNIVFILADDKD